MYVIKDLKVFRKVNIHDTICNRISFFVAIVYQMFRHAKFY